jgi:hypothetical protein
MRVCIAGSRDANGAMYQEVASYVAHLPPDAEVVHGGAGGVDAWAGHVAEQCGHPVIPVRPEYERYPPKVAPLWRNEKMAGMVDHCVVFWRYGSRGSENMIANAYALGVPVEVYVYED